jgi:deazaflavin-dependent oxidoreductase (nitroreductase family)
VVSSEHGTFTRTRMWAFKGVATRYLDPILRPIATKLPTFGVVTHRGRTSGRIYHTPVNVFRRGDAYLFFLTYGSDVEWVKNVLASGSCSLDVGGRVVDLTEPRLVTDPEVRPAPALARFIERRIAGVTQYLMMRSDSPQGRPAAARTRAGSNVPNAGRDPDEGRIE